MTAGTLSAIPREARPYQGATAGLLTRSIASLIDGVGVVGALLATYLGITGVRFLAHPVGFRFDDLPAIASVTVALIALVVYLSIAWSVTGRTYGDHVMGLRVVDRNGGKVPFRRALIRAVLSAVFPLGLLWCAASPSRRSVQDIIVRTAVVYDWSSRPERVRAGPSAEGARGVR
jgi:uncharacterized RDD family membrane protein YckC